MNPNKIVDEFLKKNAIGRYINCELEALTYTEIYCKNCTKCRIVYNQKYGNNRIICKEPMGTMGDCEYFYPTHNFEENIKEIIQGKRENPFTKTYLEVNEKMKGKLKKAIEIPDGIHTGIIKEEILRKVEYQGNEVEYLDFKVSVSDIDDDITLKFGVPYYDAPTEKSAFGKLLVKCGCDLEGEYDTEKDVVGKKIKYQTNTKETDKGSFSEVLVDTIKVIK